MEASNVRQIRGQQIAAQTDKWQAKQGNLFVPSQTRNSTTYKVDATKLTCTCPDFAFRRNKCKHVIAVEIRQGKAETETVAPFVPRNRYAQNWTAYNKSQTSEKGEFLRLLSDLTRNVREPENTNGRPALPLGDMIFSCIFKVFSQMSSRRFTTDLKDVHAKGLIAECPHYNSLIRYMEKESLTPFLELLVEETSRPLASLETAFAVDSTGLSTSNTVSWHQAKHKDPKMVTRKDWVKIHCCIGTHTNVITGVEISDSKANDHTYLIPVVEMTRRNFTVSELSADLAYSSMTHAAYTERHGIANYIPFKENANVTDRYYTTEVWRRMFHYFSMNRNEFIQHYMKRSNAETTFHMLKSKFGGTLKSKTFQAQKNEALCKVICHNISCLIHAVNEFGVEI
jgi:transposase